MSEHDGDAPENGQDTSESDEDVVFPEAEEVSEDDELQRTQHERDRMREQLLRVAADFDNFRKRSRKEIEDVRRRSIEDTLREVLPIIDNLERASEAMSDATEVAAVVDGVQMVLRGFEDVANRLGLKRVESVGAQFDPTCHDAMQQQETEEYPPGTIVSEVVPGYYLGERLLRPAMVVVAKPPAPPNDQETPGSDHSRTH